MRGAASEAGRAGGGAAVGLRACDPRSRANGARRWEVPLTLVLGLVAGCARRGAPAVAARQGTGASPRAERDELPRRSLASPGGRGAEVVQLAAGRFHTCGLRRDGSVWCWGENTQGQLGDGSRVDRPAPVEARGVTGATQIAAGYQNTCARRSDGAVLCWGDNVANQVRQTSGERFESPVLVAGVADAVEVAVGMAHVCARLGDGTVSCWGFNSYGQLGDGTTEGRGAPALVPGLTDVVQIAAAEDATCARLRDGSVRCWGGFTNTDDTVAERPRHARPVVVPGVAGAVRVTMGNSYACAVLDAGGLRCWAPYGVVRFSTDLSRAGREHGAVTVAGFPPAVRAAAGERELCALGVDARVRCRSGGAGALSAMLEPRFARDAPPAAEVPGLTDVADVVAGDQHACALRRDGGVVCWGDNERGEVGDGTAGTQHTPVAIRHLGHATQIALGARHGCARLQDGTVQCWGRNYSGQLGDGTTTDRGEPVTVPGIAHAARVAAGGWHSCALLETGAVVCWGGLGYALDGTTRDGTGATSPVALALPGAQTDLALLRWDAPIPPAEWPQFASGPAPEHDYQLASCALSASGSVHCWGCRDHYLTFRCRLADAVQGPFAPVTALEPARQVALALDHGCVLRTDGTVACWDAVVADARATDASATPPEVRPVVVAGLSDVVEVAVGDALSCARRRDGAVDCWNREASTVDYHYVAAGVVYRVAGVGRAAQVALGRAHACVRLEDGTVTCWGTNDSGQLCDAAIGPSGEPLPPVRIPGLTGVVQLALSGDSSCALLGDGSVRCWGPNIAGMLGSGMNRARSSPTEVRF